MTQHAKSSPTSLEQSPWNSLDADAFEACGLALRSSFNTTKNKSNVLSTTLNPIRQWLDEAALRVPNASHVWGSLCYIVLQEHAVRLQHYYFEDDRDRIATYLCSMESISTSAFVSRGKQVSSTWPVLDGLRTILKHLCIVSSLSSATPMLESLIEQKGWEPTRLLSRLQELRSEQRQYLQAVFGHDGIETDTPRGWLLKVLCSATLATPWRPHDSDIFGDMWDDVHALNITSSQFTQLYTALLESMPSQVAKGLHSIRLNQRKMNDTIDSFFPLPLRKCDPHALLDSIVALMAVTRFDAVASESAIANSKYFENLFIQYHPELSDLLSIHFTLFPESSASVSNAGVLVQAFESLRDKTDGLVVDTLTLPSEYSL